MSKALGYTSHVLLLLLLLLAEVGRHSMPYMIPLWNGFVAAGGGRTAIRDR